MSQFAARFAQYQDPESDGPDNGFAFDLPMPTAGQRSQSAEPKKDVEMEQPVDDSGYLDAPELLKGDIQGLQQQAMDIEEDELAPSPAVSVAAVSSNPVMPNVPAISSMLPPTASQQEPEPTLGRLSNRPPLKIQPKPRADTSMPGPDRPPRADPSSVTAGASASSMLPPSRPSSHLERSATPPNVFALPKPSASSQR